jgi:hypothetical protein
MWTKCLVWALEQKSGLGVKLFLDTFQMNQLADSPLFLLEEFCNTVWILYVNLHYFSFLVV